MKQRIKILTFAGFDPSGGAGVLADIKTFEQHKTLGFGICTANTLQDESSFLSANWIDESFIFKQLELLLKTHHFTYIKIGLIPSFSFLEKLLNHNQLKKTQFIWDPILKTSSGYSFEHQLTNLPSILSQIEILTPNWEEIQLLGNNKNAIEAAKKLSKHTNIYLKGGHHPTTIGKDMLFLKNGKQFNFLSKGKKTTAKHGSGCVFSSALAAHLALGYPLHKAILRSKSYITQFLESNTTLLGYHKRG